MLKVVLDTNVLVSALWTPAGNASVILGLILTNRIIPCFDQRILDEYLMVLSRPRFAFPSGQVEQLLLEISNRGLSVTVSPSTISMPDETDRKFFDVARYFEAYLITGNLKHYPKTSWITSPAHFIATCNLSEH